MSLAYCGLKCDECPVYLATINNNKEEQSRLAKEYSTDTCKFTRNDMLCLGCRSDNPSEKMCSGCGIRQCGVRKSCSICSECNEFPCSIQLAVEYKNR